jgi:hypothetical protein
MMMGMWFISSFVGNYLQGYLGTYWSKMPKTTFFFMLTGLAWAASAMMLAVMVPLKKALGPENKAGGDDPAKSSTEPATTEPEATEDEHRTVTKSGIPPRVSEKSKTGSASAA